MYGHAINFCKWCVDVSHVSKCENCYEGFWLTQCSTSSFCSQCENSFQHDFSKIVSVVRIVSVVSICIKSYCIFNKQYTKDEYIQKIKDFNLGLHKSAKTKKRF